MITFIVSVIGLALIGGGLFFAIATGIVFGRTDLSAPAPNKDRDSIYVGLFITLAFAITGSILLMVA